MPVEPIALQVQVPQPVLPLQSVGALMQLRSGMQEHALRAAQTEQAKQQTANIQAEAQQRNKDLADENTVQSAQGDPSLAGKLGAGDFSALEGKIQPKTLQGLKVAHQQIVEKAATQATTDLTLNEKRHQAIADSLAGLKQLAVDHPEDGEEKAIAEYPNAIGRLVGEGVLKQGTFPATITNLKDLDRIAAANNLYSAVNAKALATKKEQQGIATSAATAQKDIAQAGLEGAQTPGAKAKSDIEVAQAAAMKNLTPETLGAQVDAELNPANYKDSKIAAEVTRENAIAKTAALAALPNGLPAVQAAIKDSVDRIGRLSTGVASAAAQVPTKITIAQGTEAAKTAAATPTSQALDLMAEAALNGQAPTSRNPVIVAKIWDRAAEIAKDHGMSAAQAIAERNSAQANKGALNSLTKQYEILKPFAEMADKNADILEQKMKDVTNLGAPFLNTPIRELEQKFGGSTSVSAFKAAMQPVQADFARILNSPTGGGVLSDNARHEMQGALSPGATPGQIKAALDVFRTDAKNRKEAYEASLADLKGKSVSAAGGTAEKPKTESTGKYKAGDTRVVQGVTYKRDEQGAWHPQ